MFYIRNLDNKGRVTIPKKMRKGLSEQFLITKENDMIILKEATKDNVNLLF